MKIVYNQLKTGFAACLLLNGSGLISRKIKMTTDWTAQIYPVSVLLQLALIQLLALPVSSVWLLLIFNLNTFEPSGPY